MGRKAGGQKSATAVLKQVLNADFTPKPQKAKSDSVMGTGSKGLDSDSSSSSSQDAPARFGSAVAATKTRRHGSTLASYGATQNVAEPMMPMLSHQHGNLESAPSPTAAGPPKKLKRSATS